MKETLLFCLKSQVCRALKPMEISFETKIIRFWWFLGPADQNNLHHTPLMIDLRNTRIPESKLLHVEKRGEPAEADNYQWRHQ